MEPILKKRINTYIGPDRIWNNIFFRGLKASWPLARLELYRNHLILDILNKNLKINYNKIDYLDWGFLKGIQIHHHSNEVDNYVYFSGFGNGLILYKRLKNIIKKNKLKINAR